VDKNPLTLGQLTVLEESLPGGECGKWYGGALYMIKCFWFWCNEFFLEDHVISSRAIAVKGAEGENFIFGGYWRSSYTERNKAPSLRTPAFISCTT